MLRSSKTRKCRKMLGKPKENQGFSGAIMVLDRPKKAPRSPQDGFKLVLMCGTCGFGGPFGFVNHGTKRILSLRSLKMIEDRGRWTKDRVQILKDAQMS